MAKLSAKQQRFVDEYLIDLNATQAAIRAGYSTKTAQVQSSRLLSNVMVQLYMQKRMAEKESELIASQDEVLQTLTAVMRREKKEVVVSTQRIRKSHYDNKGRKIVDETEVPVCVEIDTKISDVNKAAELLGKRWGIFTDSIDLNADMELNINITRK